jgi:hypothetical protein
LPRTRALTASIITHNAESLNIGQTRPLAGNGLPIIQLRGVKERPQSRMQLLSNDALKIYRVFYELLVLLYEMISWDFCDQELLSTGALFSAFKVLWVFLLPVKALLSTVSHNSMQSVLHYATLKNL